MPPEIATIIIVAMVGGFALVSKLMRFSPTACCSDSDWSAVASTVPSFGATL